MTFFTAAPRRLLFLAAIISSVTGVSLVGTGAASGVASDLRAADRSQVSAPVAQNPAEQVLDHFLCYGVTTGGVQLPRAVSVLDQFFPNRTRVSLGHRNMLCTPAEKDKPGGAVLARIKFPLAHLVCYTMKQVRVPPTDRTVVVNNQLKPRQLLHPSALVQLCLPSGKALAGSTTAPVIPLDLDHFTCYAVRGGPIKRQLTLRDQFTHAAGTTKYGVVVTHPVSLCNPAEKYVSGKQRNKILSPQAHLVCYGVRITSGRFRAQRVTITNQFEQNRTIAVFKPVSLCVPSLKKIIQAAAG